MRTRILLIGALSAAIAAWLIYYDWTTWQALRENLTLLAEFGIVVVIYYEVEENRATAFLDSVSAEDSYSARAEVYESYVACGGDSLAERAERFRRALWASHPLRKQCDSQWVHFTRLQYGLRRSFLHRNLLADWYPHVIVSMWAVIGRYVRERQELRPSAATMFFEDAVRRSLTRLEKDGVRQVGIFGKEGQKVMISEGELATFRRDLYGPFAIGAPS